jgi:hypothetical protein
MLTAFGVYGLLTALDGAYLGHYSPKSLTHVRERLARLCGNKDLTDKDFEEGYPLVRFGFPTGRLGNLERIYSLSSTGSKIVESLGHPVSCVKPSKLHFSHSHLLHNLTLNRTVIALHAWARSKPNLSVESHLSYSLAKTPAEVSITMQGKTVKVAVIPDSLLLIENVRLNQRLVILWEIDHNSESLPRLRTHLAARLAVVLSSQFKKTYGDIPYRIAYATQGVTDAAAKARLSSLCTTTRAVLTALKKPEYAKYFRFTTINFPTLYEDSESLFEGAVWYRPDAPTTPIPLLTG